MDSNLAITDEIQAVIVDKHDNGGNKSATSSILSVKTLPSAATLESRSMVSKLSAPSASSREKEEEEQVDESNPEQQQRHSSDSSGSIFQRITIDDV